MDFVDVNESNARWVQDFRLKAYSSPAKLESIDGERLSPHGLGVGFPEGLWSPCGPSLCSWSTLGDAARRCDCPGHLCRASWAQSSRAPSVRGGAGGGWQHAETRESGIVPRLPDPSRCRKVTKQGVWAAGAERSCGARGGPGPGRWPCPPSVTDRPVVSPRCPVPRTPDPQLPGGPGRPGQQWLPGPHPAALPL